MQSFVIALHPQYFQIELCTKGIKLCAVVLLYFVHRHFSERNAKGTHIENELLRVKRVSVKKE